jgi:hypothetical protein
MRARGLDREPCGEGLMTYDEWRAKKGYGYGAVKEAWDAATTEARKPRRVLARGWAIISVDGIVESWSPACELGQRAVRVEVVEVPE